MLTLPWRGDWTIWLRAKCNATQWAHHRNRATSYPVANGSRAKKASISSAGDLNIFYVATMDVCAKTRQNHLLQGKQAYDGSPSLLMFEQASERCEEEYRTHDAKLIHTKYTI